MKNIIKVLLLAFIMPFQTITAQDTEVKNVHDESLQQQIKFTYGWEQYELTTDSLTPQWWYWAFEHVFGDYMDGDYYPNYRVTLGTALHSTETKNKTEKQEKAMDTVYKQELIKDIYNTVDIAYLLEELQFKWRIDTFNFYNNKIRQIDLPESNRLANNMNDLFIESYEKVRAIKSSYIENHKREEAYLQYEEEMDEIITYQKRLYKLIKLCKSSPFNH